MAITFDLIAILLTLFIKIKLAHILIYIFLGCVHMKYVSPEEGFSVNVSYGKNLIHSSKIQGNNGIFIIQYYCPQIKDALKKAK